MRNHVHRLLTAYVHHQLPRARQIQVARHVQQCARCRAALAREERLARDLKTYMPLVGQPARGQLARLWPAIWAEVRLPGAPGGLPGVRLPSYGMALALMLLCAFATTAFLSGPVHVNAALLPPVPAEIEATWTPVHTEQPMAAGTAAHLQPTASQVATAYILPPMASPVPDAAGREPGGNR